MICSKSHSRASVLKSDEENWEPLSVLTMSGMPCLAHRDFRHITDEALVSYRARNSKKLEWSSTMMIYSVLSSVNRSTVTFDQGRSVTFCGTRVSLGK